jgi:hypothetical protein
MLLILPRSEAAELEIKLHEVKARSKICMRLLRTAASDETAKLTAKIDAIGDELVKLERSDGALRRTISELLECKRQLEAQIEHHTVPKEDWDRASREIASLQDELRDGLHVKTAEIRKLHGAMQVVPTSCDDPSLVCLIAIA